MEIPKYIEKWLERRAKLASQLEMLDFDISDWLDKHNIEVESEDYRGGVELYVNPYDSIERIKAAILNHKEEKGE